MVRKSEEFERFDRAVDQLYAGSLPHGTRSRLGKEHNTCEKVPFRIAAEYQRLFQTKTPADEILADDARLW